MAVHESKNQEKIDMIAMCRDMIDFQGERYMGEIQTTTEPIGDVKSFDYQLSKEDNVTQRREEKSEIEE